LNELKSPGNLERWTAADSAELYSVKSWGSDYFDISEKGEALVYPFGKTRGSGISVMDIISGIEKRGLGMPVLLRFENILDTQLTYLHECFRAAIRESGYKNIYKGVYPIKVNQQQQVIEEVSRFGARYQHGLEAGSKAELIAAIPYISGPDSLLICNGYKDAEFIDLGLYARKMGVQCVFVVERPGELRLIAERAALLGVKPLIGARVKLSALAGGHWTESGGPRSVFGLNIAQLIEMVDYLRGKGMLDCFKLLHYHIGSQIPNIKDIRAAVAEACRVYSGLAEDGVPMEYLDLGGGLAVDYDGSHTNFPSSRNYTVREYCADIIEVIMTTLDNRGVPHPVIITESGRATVAYYSVLVFNALDTSRFESVEIPGEIPCQPNENISNLLETLKAVNSKNIQECYHDALFYRDEIRQHFKHGAVTLRQRAFAESVFWNIVNEIARSLKKLKYIPDEFENLDVALSDIYYCNFSVFQSLPDVWAVDQLFPIMPLHRLDEKPVRQAILSDITCDCDGKIDRFIDLHDVRHTLPLHPLKDGENYYLGAFLVGAYQETLGDLHNLLGDTNVVSIRAKEDGSFEIAREIEGDSVADVLSYLEYEPKDIMEKIRNMAEDAIQAGRIAPQDRPAIMNAFENGVRGYTYFEQ
jgi:arginine decarboxylase